MPQSLVRFIGSIVVSAACLPGAVVRGVAEGAAAVSPIPWDAGGYKGWKVSDLRISGIDETLAEALSAGLALAPQGRLLRGDVTARFFPAALEQDLERIRLFLARNGYPDVEMNVDLVPDHEDRELAIEVRIEGEPTRVAEIVLAGFPEGWGTTAGDLEAVRVGDVFTDAGAEASAGRLRRELGDAGYAKAEVRAAARRRSETSVGVTFHARPGTVYHFRRTRVVGASDNLRDLARVSAGVPEGSLYSAKRLREADDQLRLLDVFARIRITTEDAGPESLDVLIDVSEREPRSVEIGGGYWTDEGIRGTASWKHRNLFGRGRSFEVGTSASQYEQHATGVIKWPALLGAGTSILLQGAIRNQIEANYDELDVDVGLFLRYFFSSRSNVTVGPNLSLVNVDLAEGFEGEALDENLVLDFRVRGQHNHADDPIRPTRGRRVGWRAEWAPPPVSDSRYVLGEVETVWYAELPFASVLRARLNLGLADTYAGTEGLLPNRRFFSGGGNSHRGFGRRKLGPLDDNGDPLGGEALLNASLDLRFTLFWVLKGALFVDAGQVWADPSDARADVVEVAVGPGLWIDTPVGPFRFDYGIRLTDFSPEPKTQYHIAIGNPF